MTLTERCRAAGLPHAPDDGDLVLADLHQDLDSVAVHLVEQLGRQAWLDAFLLCAAADQVLEDALGGRRTTGRRFWWRRVAAELDRGPRIRLVAAAVRVAVAATDRLAVRTPSGRRLSTARRSTSSLADALADVVMGRAPVSGGDAATLVGAGALAAARIRSLPARLRHDPLHLPACFRSFDQHPDDLGELVRRLSARWPDKAVALTVVGVRTSGSYLAPLLAAAARHAGYAGASATTLRPGVTPGPSGRALLATAVRDRHLVLIVDDPPVTGHSVRMAAERLLSLGVSPDRLVLVLAVPDEDGMLPPALAPYQQVTLEGPAWHVHAALDAERVRAGLQGMLPERVTVSGVHRVRGPEARARGHVRARYTLSVTDADADSGTGATTSVDLVVEGSGLGFFGRHSLAVARAVPEFVPTVFGFDDGLVYREWLPGTPCAPREGDPALAARIGAYVAQRHAALATASDPSRALGGDQPVWEVASLILSSALGKARLALRPFVVEPLVQRVLRVPHPSVVDGTMGADRWIRVAAGSGTGSPFAKVDFAAGDFSNLDLSCYDPVFDLAAAALELDPGPHRGEVTRALCDRFSNESGLEVDDDRWVLYQLVLLWDAGRSGRMTPAAVRAASSLAVYRYLAQVFLSDLPVPRDGPLCAVDLDGVLEGGALGFSTTTAAGALALRALRAHGYRLVLASGRSVAEVADRCSILGAAGGVAEYGSTLFDARTGDTVELLTTGEAASVTGLQEWLRRRSHDGGMDLEVDATFRRIARVRRPGGDAMGAVPAAALRGLPPPQHGEWQLIVGDDQTDIVAPGIDKARALQVLAARLGERDAAAPIALAVGDTGADVTMLQAAAVAYAPANASPAVRTSGARILKSAYQDALAVSVGRLIGHRVGSCGRCASPELSSDRAALLQALSLQEAGGRGMPLRIGRLLWSSRDRGSRR